MMRLLEARDDLVWTTCSKRGYLRTTRNPRMRTIGTLHRATRQEFVPSDRLGMEAEGRRATRYSNQFKWTYDSISRAGLATSTSVEDSRTG
jgi:hypothetical protein